MAGSYRKKSASRQGGNLLGQLLLVLVVFIAGYLSASLYDLARVTNWVGAHVLANNSAALIVNSGAQQAALPKPKFEFYTLLANERVAGAAPDAPSLPTAVLPAKALPLHAPLAPVAAVALTNPAPVVTTAKMAAPITNSRDAYTVQVGSFKRRQEAERMKATLAMKGFDVQIASISQQNVNWYRVIIGPFASRMQAQQAQVAFARREHITGMIRKMDA